MKRIGYFVTNLFWRGSVFIMLFASGDMPLSILLVSSIVQDGHGSLPLLAASRKSFIIMKLINMVVGFLVGSGRAQPGNIKNRYLCRKKYTRTKHRLMKTILIPVDFSEGSLHSCKYAMKLTGNQKVTFHLFHIYNDQVMVPDSGLPEAMDTDVFFNSDIVLALKEQAEQQMVTLKKEVEMLIKNSGQEIAVTTSLQGGDPRWEITEICEDLQPDMVVMGTRGMGEKGFLEGSMAAKIMAKVPIPVLAVPENYSGFQLRNIMFPTHFNKLDIYTLQQLFKLLGHLNFKIHICHLHLGKKNQEAGILMEELEKAFEKEKQDGKIGFALVEATDKTEALKTFAEDNKIDLIAFLPEKGYLIRHLFSSHRLLKKDFFKLELPMLAMHE